MSSSPTPIPCGIDAIANAYGIFHCVHAADAMQYALIIGGVSGTRLELSMPQFGGIGTFGNIFADEGRFAGRCIATNGQHVGIEIGGRVYDNNRPTGTMRVDWMEKMQTQFGSVADAVAQGIMVLQETVF